VVVNDESLSHLHAPYRAYALLSASERIQWIRQDRWIHYSRAEQVLNRLSDLLTYPARDRMPCLLLFGPTGMGKTRIVQKFLREHRSSFDDVTGRTRLPIVAVQMPPAPSERDLYEELLVSMGAVLPSHQGVTTLRQRTRITARQLEVRMLVIDEIHSILAGTFREQRIVLNAIRFLANDLRIPLVCVGTHEAKQALMTDQQLADRFEAWELPPWQDDPALLQLLASFAAILPLRRASELRDPKIRNRVLVLTEGVTVRICRLLEAAAIQAIEKEHELINLQMLTDDLTTETLVSISDRRTRRTN
jgi:replication-associated recombination protein RarA